MKEDLERTLASLREKKDQLNAELEDTKRQIEDTLIELYKLETGFDVGVRVSIYHGTKWDKVGEIVGFMVSHGHVSPRVNEIRKDNTVGKRTIWAKWATSIEIVEDGEEETTDNV